MPDYTSSAKSILSELLSAGPIRGARLKLLFARAFETREGIPYQDAFARFSKFSELLVQFQDVLQIEWSNGPGDITVRRRDVLLDPSSAPESAERPPSAASTFMRTELWQAFTNPDPRRRRFVNRITGEIVHFLDGSSAEPNPRFADRVAKEAAFVELRPVSAEEQKAWMKEFINSDHLPEVRRRVVAPILDLPYSSQVNTLLLGGLGDHAEAWRAFRAARVYERIERWCAESAVPFDDILRPHRVRALAGQSAETASQQLATLDLVGRRTVPESELRRYLRHAIDAMNEDDLERVLVPASTLMRLHSGRPS